MFKKHKQLIVGFTLGALMFGIIPAEATIQNYILKKSPDKFIVDGGEIVNEELPMLKYGGYNYIPAAIFREICDRIGVGFEWAGKEKEIHIDTGKDLTTTRPREKNDHMEMTRIQKDGFSLVKVNDSKYITAREIYEYLKDNNLNYRIGYYVEEKKIQFYRTESEQSHTEDLMLIEDIPYQPIGEHSCIEYDYFRQNILPLIR